MIQMGVERGKAATEHRQNNLLHVGNTYSSNSRHHTYMRYLSSCCRAGSDARGISVDLVQEAGHLARPRGQTTNTQHTREDTVSRLESLIYAKQATSLSAHTGILTGIYGDFERGDILRQPVWSVSCHSQSKTHPNTARCPSPQRRQSNTTFRHDARSKPSCYVTIRYAKHM